MSPVADQERTERLAEQHRREIVDAAERLLLIWMWERSKALGMSLEAFEKSMAIK